MFYTNTVWLVGKHVQCNYSSMLVAYH